MNNFNPNIHHRRSIRLKGYDYSQPGFYFVTICSQNRDCLFGKIENGKMILNDAGIMVVKEWLKIPDRFQNTRLHEYILMPNHFHAILEIVGATLVVAKGQIEQGQPQGIATEIVDGQIEQGQPQGIAPNKQKKLGDILGAFQSITTVQYIRGVKSNNWQPFKGKLWQRNYYEHIIRNEKSLQRIANYIKKNPQSWADETSAHFE